MLSPQALLKGLVQRALPYALTDGPEAERFLRLSRYGDIYIHSLIRKQHLLADEGSYFVTNNSSTAITGQTNTAFTAVNPTVSIFNRGSPTDSQAKRIYLDYIYLLNGGTAFTNATSNTGTFCAVLLDSQDGVTGGTALSPLSVNQDISPANSIASIRVGALTAPTGTAALRTIVGQRLVRAPVSATALTLANLDFFYFNFGSVEPTATMVPATSSTATLEVLPVMRHINLPPIVIGPGQSIWFYIFSVAAGAVTAGNFLPEIGWWER